MHKKRKPNDDASSPEQKKRKVGSGGQFSVNNVEKCFHLNGMFLDTIRNHVNDECLE